MAVLNKPFFFILFLTLFFSSSFHLIQAVRDAKYFFNKIPSTNDNGYYLPKTEEKQQISNFPEQQHEEEPKFSTENENSHGLFGPATTAAADQRQQPDKRHLPKNYNPVSYVTVAEDSPVSDAAGDEEESEEEDIDDSSFVNDKEFTPTTTSTAAAAGLDGNRYYDNSNRQSSMPIDESASFMEQSRSGHNPTAASAAGEENNYYGNGAGVEKMGMSDTRFLENGKYYYDVKTEKYARHPLENAGIDLASLKNSVRPNQYVDTAQFQDDENQP
ncbi:unnamed protein product [Cuscuta epithymum]|uniref:Uncharacterized protein n=1 Tax=Cuscuta epithymum TaxID=186058 RepID=A0AAV0ENG1_9ASTE|nr:unnamed protein product [Cuscuta epithymum]